MNDPQCCVLRLLPSLGYLGFKLRACASFSVCPHQFYTPRFHWEPKETSRRRMERNSGCLAVEFRKPLLGKPAVSHHQPAWAWHLHVWAFQG